MIVEKGLHKVWRFAEALDIRKNNPQSVIAHTTLKNADGVTQHPFFVGSTAVVVANYVVKHDMTASRPHEGATMLLLDIECYPPSVVAQTALLLGANQLIPEAYTEEEKPQSAYVEQFLNCVQSVVKCLVEFTTKYTDTKVDVSSFCVDEACSREHGGKLR
jgi:hypothetical protein